MLKLIVCIDKNWGIAKNGNIPWDIHEEKKFFKKTVDAQTIVMGHNTYNTIKNGLSSSEKIVFSFNKKLKLENAITTNDYQKIVKQSQLKDIYVIGGKQIYDLFLPFADELIISHLDQDFKCDLRWKPNLKFFELKNSKKHQKFTISIYQSYKDKLIDGKRIALLLEQKLNNKCKFLIKTHQATPKLVVIFIGNNPASEIYVQRKKLLAQRLGISVEIIKFAKINIYDLKIIIDKLNNDDEVHGILIQHPLPINLNEDIVSNLITPLKDVDCFNPYNVGLVFKNASDKNINSIPCTPWGILTLLKHYHIFLESKRIVVLGRSNIVGKPLIPLLLKENATVIACHSKTTNLKSITKQADILISAIGKANFVDHTYIKKNVILVDVGISRDKNNNICGDIDFVDCVNYAQLITPVPGGIGPMTLIMLFTNLLNLYQKQKTHNKVFEKKQILQKT